MRRNVWLYILANAIRTARIRYVNLVAQEWNFSSKGERDLGVRVDNELGFSQHIRAATSKANSMIGLLKNAFVCRDVEKSVCEPDKAAPRVCSECVESATAKRHRRIGESSKNEC